MKVYRHALHLLRVNLPSLLSFEVLFKLFSYGILTPAVMYLFKLSQRAAGLRYLSGENLARYLRCPTTWAVAGLILLLLALINVMDAAAVLFCFDVSRRGEKIKPWDLFLQGFSALRGLVHGRLYPLLFVLVSIPLSSATLISGYLSTVQLPEFLYAYLERRPTISAVYNTVVILSGLILILGLFSLHYYLLERRSIPDACRRSRRLLRGRYGKTLLSIAGWELGCYAIYYILIFVLALILTLLARVLADSQLAFVISMRILSVVHTGLTLLFSAVTIPLFYAFLSAAFFRAKALEGEAAVKVPYTPARLPFPRPRLFTAALVGLLVLLNASNVFLYTRGVIDLTSDLTNPTSVTAHRGFSRLYPENTLEAFSAAIEAGTDWIELDVQQTRDGVLVVMHDANLLRTTGLNQNIWELDYETLRELDCGSWLSPRYADCRIPTLSEALDLCRGKVRLNIELKPTGHETALVEQVVDMLREKEMLAQCVVASMKYEIVEQVRAYEPELPTVYIMTAAYGNITRLDAADAYSIQAAFITKTLVSTIHDQGKDIYAWTVNRATNMERMLDLGVDNLITDDPVLAQEVIASKRHSGFLNDYISRLLARS